MRTQEEINYYLQDTTIKNARNLLDIELCINNNNLHLPNNVIIHENGISFAEFYKWFENRCFKEGDICTTQLGTIFIYRSITTSNFCGSYVSIDNKDILNIHYNSFPENCCRLATKEEKQKLFDAIKTNGYRWNSKSKTLENWTIQDAKDGDVIFYDDGWTCIFKHIHGIWYSSYCFITSDREFHTSYERHAVDSTINGNAHPATKEQCNFLFQKIKEAGYKWNPETKTLEKLVKPKFKVGDRIKKEGKIATILRIYENCYDVRYDSGIGSFTIDLQDEWELIPNKFDITTLKPFDKVLVRDYNYEQWSTAVYSHKQDDHFVASGHFKQCIPYEGNEHLLGTSNNCDDFYKTWE